MAEQEKPQVDPKDLENRVKGFNEELIPLLGKYKLGLGAVPYIHEGMIVARPHLFDDSQSSAEPAAQAQAEDKPAAIAEG